MSHGGCHKKSTMYVGNAFDMVIGVPENRLQSSPMVGKER